MIEEIIHPIIGYEGAYKISSYGYIISCAKTRGMGNIVLREAIKKPSNNGSGYLITSLCKNGRKKSFYIHRLVAQHFIPNPDNLPEVGHGLLGKECNAVWNLCWTTRLENEKEAWRRGEKGRGSRHQNSKPVFQYTLDGDFVKSYENAIFAMEETGFENSMISRAARGVLPHAYGFKWKYDAGDPN